MYERLLLAEIVMADLTFANANVFYELGIRHAARPRSTILIFAAIGTLPWAEAAARRAAISGRQSQISLRASSSAIMRAMAAGSGRRVQE
jgi:hypothetical protein